MVGNSTMSEFGNRFASRLPQSWASRAVWLVLGISAAWVAYRFGVNYGECRAGGTPKPGCVLTAVGLTYFDVVLHIGIVVTKLLAAVLP